MKGFQLGDNANEAALCVCGQVQPPLKFRGLLYIAVSLVKPFLWFISMV